MFALGKAVVARAIGFLTRATQGLSTVKPFAKPMTETNADSSAAQPMSSQCPACDAQFPPDRVLVSKVAVESTYKRSAETLTSKYFARFFTKPHVGDFTAGKFKDKLAASPELTKKFAKTLWSTGYRQPLPIFAHNVDNLYAMRNVSQHKNTNKVLRREMEELYKAGVPDLLEASMPEAAHIIRHYDQFLALLPSEKSSTRTV